MPSDMDASLINPFVNATVHVLGTMALVKPRVGTPYVKKDNAAKGDVSGVIGFTGEANGTLSVSFDEGSILKIVSNMFGEAMTTLDDEVADAVGELTNMISGQARRELEEKGWIFEAATPSVITGKAHTIVHITNGPKIAIPFSMENGHFTVEVCLEKYFPLGS
jgi:chemotaxis protein CheX